MSAGEPPRPMHFVECLIRMTKNWIALESISTALPPAELGLRAPTGWPDPLAAELVLRDLRVVVLETAPNAYELIGPVGAYAELYRALGGNPKGRLQAIVCRERDEAEKVLEILRVVRWRAADPNDAAARAADRILNPTWTCGDRAMLVGMPKSTWSRRKSTQAPESAGGIIKLAGLGDSVEGEE